MAMLAGVFGVRDVAAGASHLGRLRWAIVWMLLILHLLIMKASVWGSSGVSAPLPAPPVSTATPWWTISHAFGGMVAAWVGINRALGW